MAMRGRRGAILVVGAIGLLAAGCGGSAPGGSGDVLLTMTVSVDIAVQAVGYTIADKVHPALHGTVTVPKPQQPLVKLLHQVPPSDAYVVTAHAVSVDGQHVCDGTASFKVAKAAMTRVEVLLTCTGPGRVVVGIGVSCHESPLVAFVVSPLVAPVGKYVIGRAVATRPDGGPLTFAWSASSGTFTAPTEAQTDFTCTRPGPVEVTLKVQDDEQCQQSPSVVVTCLEGDQDSGVEPDAASDGGAD